MLTFGYFHAKSLVSRINAISFETNERFASVKSVVGSFHEMNKSISLYFLKWT